MRAFPLPLLTVFVLGWFAQSADGWAASAPVHEYRLDNGMRVLVKEDHRAPVAVSMVWYVAGSIDDFNGT